jgi:hypothetical protein
MKRLSMLAMGVFCVCLFMPALVQADQLFVAGPLENEKPNTEVVWTKILNNNSKTSVTVNVKVFGLNGTKTLVDSQTFTIGPESSGFINTDVSELFEYDVEVKVYGPDRTVDKTLISVFGKDAEGNLVGAHRVLKSEMTVYKKDSKDEDD